ncbi:MAG: hypothetical protein ABIF11_01695 [Nitrospirota bacterium]
MTNYYITQIFGAHYDGPSYFIGLIPFVVGIILVCFLEEFVACVINYLMTNDEVMRIRVILSSIIVALVIIFSTGCGLLFYHNVYLNKEIPGLQFLLNVLFFLFYLGLFSSGVYILLVLWGKKLDYGIGQGGLCGLIFGISVVLSLDFIGLEHYDKILVIILFAGLGLLWGLIGRKEVILQKWVLLLFPVEQSVIISLIFSVFLIWFFRAIYGIDFENERFLSLVGLFLSAITVTFTSIYLVRVIQTEPFDSSPYKKNRYLKLGLLIFLFFWIGGLYSILTIKMTP